MKGNSIDNFLLLVRAGLFGPTEGILCESVDWSEVYQLAKEQGLLGIVAEGMEVLRFRFQDSGFRIQDGTCGASMGIQFNALKEKLEQRNIVMNKFVATLFDRLHGKDIHPILLKGQGVAQCYDKPLLRMYGDVDLLLSQEQYQEAKNYLLPFASMTKDSNEHKKEFAMRISNFQVELHGSLRCGFSTRIDRELDKIYRDAFVRQECRTTFGDVPIHLLGEGNNVFYVFVHLLNHFYKGGVGIRQICDWCRLLWTFRKSLDRGAMESRLNKMRLMSEWRAFGTFAVEYLGMPTEAMPFYSDDEKWRRKARQILAFVLKVGNLGANRKGKTKSAAGLPHLLVRKIKSSKQRICDLANHFTIFPMDTLRFFPNIFFNGFRQK